MSVARVRGPDYLRDGANSTLGAKRGQFDACSDEHSSALCKLWLCFTDLSVQRMQIAKSLINIGDPGILDE